MKKWFKVGLLCLVVGLCSFLCLAFCSEQVMAAGSSSYNLPFSEYGANDIYFYNPCTIKDKSSGNINSNFSANCHVEEVTWADLEGLGGNARLRLLLEHYGEFAMLLQKYYGVPWEMPFAIMVFESGVGTGAGVGAHVKEEANLFNWAGLTLGGPSTASDHYAHDGYYYLTCPDGQCNHFGGYDTISAMLLGIVVAHMRNGHNGDSGYDGGLKMLDPDNYRLEEAINPLMSGYCVPTPAYPCYNDKILNMMRGTQEWPEIADVTREKGWMTSEELAKAWNIKPGGIATEKFGWGNIKEQIWEEWGASGVPCSDGESGKKGKGSKKEEKDKIKKSKEKNTEKTEDTKDDSDKGDSSNDDETKTASSNTKLQKPKNEWLDKAGLEGFKILKALNSEAPYGHIDTAAMEEGTDSYTSYASDAGNGTGLPGFIVLHWTASGGVSGDYHWSIFGDGSSKIYPPHFAIDVVQKKIWQYFPLSSPSAAVKAWDQYGVQIEVVGWPDDTAGSQYNIYKFTNDQYEYLAKLLIAISNETGIPLESSLTWATGQGGDIAPKLSAEETKKYIGVLGHEHLPNQDGKWDPGKMWEYLVPALERLGYEYSPNGGGGSGGLSGDEEIICPEDEKSGASGCGGEKIAEVARELAWPDGNHSDQIKPEFAAAAIEVGLDWYATSKHDAQDCGKFTGVVVRKAVDMNYPPGYTPTIEEYLSNSSLWEEIPNQGNESNLEPGDVMVGNEGSFGYGSKVGPTGGGGGAGHAMIYIGDGKVASASLDTRTGDLVQAVAFSSSRHGFSYRIFRYVGDGDCGDEEEASTGSFDEDLKNLEKGGAKVGVAVSAPENKKASKVKVGGSWSGGRAWSTIKVPLAIAAIQEKASTGSVTDPYGGSCNHSLNSAVTAAIAQSDNCAAWWLWQALGGDGSSAAKKVTEVIRAGGDSSTNVTSTGDGSSLTSGKTNWSLVNQAIFAANMASISKSSDVLSAMKKHNAGDGGHGLASNYTSMVKGGWGDTDGAATRQFGLVKLKDGKCSAVAIGTDQGSSFTTLDKIVKVLLNHEDDLPSGKCPKGL